MMRPWVNFVDTSIVCNLLSIPGKCSDREEVAQEHKAKQDARESFILPVTAVIETSNHIRHVPNGIDRRVCAEKFASMLRLVAEEKSPWILNEFTWGRGTIQALLEGCETGMTFVEHSVGGLGGGDLCILCEKQIYRERTKISAVRVWSRDVILRSHD